MSRQIILDEIFELSQQITYLSNIACDISNIELSIARQILAYAAEKQVILSEKTRYFNQYYT